MCNKRCDGMTLIELVIAIVVIGVGLAGILAAFSTVRGSADPLIHKQMLAAAEEMLEEIELKPYAVSGTAPANGATSCGNAADRSGFDDVRDYNGYRTSGICGVDGTAVVGLESYGVNVAVTQAAWQGIAETLSITVTVSHGLESLSITGYRTNYGG